MGLLAIYMALVAELQFVNTTPHLDVAHHLGVVPAQFLGFEITDDPEIRQTEEPQFRVARIARIQTHWTIEHVFPPGLRCFVRIKGSGAGGMWEMPFMGTGESIGTTRVVEIPIEIPRFTHAGTGTLTFGLRWPNRDGTTSEVVSYRGPSHTAPISTTSTFDPTRLEKLFGTNATRLKTSFRLGENARIRIPKKNMPTSETAEIGIISALHHSDEFNQGELVAEIIVRGRDDEGTYSIRAGIETSLSEYDVPRPGILTIDKAAVASQRPHPGDRHTWDHKPLQLYTYHARIPLDPTITIEDIEVRYVANKGVIDVFELVLIAYE